MAVGMLDRPERSQGGCHDPGLFPQLAPGRVPWGLGRLDLAAGKLPEAAEQPLRRTELDQPSTPVFEYRHRRDDVGARCTNGGSWNGTRIVEFEMGAAVGPHRTSAAERCSRPADRLAELHHGLVELPHVAIGQEGFEGRPKAVANRCRPDVPFLPCPAGRDAKGIGLQGNLVRVERETRDRPRDVGADPREGLELRNGPRHGSAEGGIDDPGRRMEVSGPGVVPRPFPRLHHVGDARVRERGDGRESREEPVVVGDGLLHARLLKQHFGDPDPVGVPVPAPGERPTVGAKPPPQRRARIAGDGRMDTGRGAAAHGRPPEEESA
jgi:hypothetical protein